MATQLSTVVLALLRQVPGPSPQESQRAAIAIVLIMLGGLLLTIGLLRWVAKREREKAGGVTEAGPWKAIEERLAQEDRQVHEESPSD